MLSTLIGNSKLTGVGVVFEPYQFAERNQSQFAPYSYRIDSHQFAVDDLGRYGRDHPRSPARNALLEELHARYSLVNVAELETFTAKIKVRASPHGGRPIEHSVQYLAAGLHQGKLLLLCG